MRISQYHLILAREAATATGKSTFVIVLVMGGPAEQTNPASGSRSFEGFSMKSSIPLLAGILALLLITAGAFTCSGFKYVISSSGTTQAEAADAKVILPPVPEVLRSPHALLVLDVSGSMKTSDPEFLQSEAVLRFCDVYAALAREITGTEEYARLAVVLFSTIPQIVDWDGSQDPWLVLDDSSLGSLRPVVKAYLGPSEDDPRDGYDTDYFWALQEVDRLIAELESPPAVVFMTDGVCEPAPLLSPLLSQEQRREAFPQSFAENIEVIRAAARGESRWLDVGSEDCIFLASELTREAQGLDYDHNTKAQIPHAVQRAKQALFRREYWLSRDREHQPLLWAPVYLGVSDKDTDWDEIGGLLSGDSVAEAWQLSRGFVHCSAAHELVSEFIQILAHWFRLDAQDVESGSESIQVPLLTQAFAAHVRTREDAPHFLLRGDGSTTHLSGQGREWAGVVAGGGHFQFDAGGVTVESGSIHRRPRFEWALKVPEWETVTASGCSVSVGLSLLSLEEGGCVPADEVYPDLPSSLPLEYAINGGKSGAIRQISRSSPNDPETAYHGELYLTSPPMGELEVTIDLRRMREYGVEIRRSQLSRKIDLRPQVRFVLRDSEGRPTSIHVEGIPREAESLKKTVEGLRGAF